jgi:hypothetical protein
MPFFDLLTHLRVEMDRKAIVSSFDVLTVKHIEARYGKFESEDICESVHDILQDDTGEMVTLTYESNLTTEVYHPRLRRPWSFLVNSTQYSEEALCFANPRWLEWSCKARYVINELRGRLRGRVCLL